MKYVWEEEDINVCIKVVSSDKKELYVIGYDIDSRLESKDYDHKKNKGYALISLDHIRSHDGRIILKEKTRKEMADFLNKEGFRPLTTEMDVVVQRLTIEEFDRYIKGQVVQLETTMETSDKLAEKLTNSLIKLGFVRNV